MKIKRKLKKLEGGAQFDVAHDGSKIYKKPKKNIFLKLYGEADYRQIKRDIKKIEEVFGRFYLKTKVKKSHKNGYVLVQDYIREGKEIDMVRSKHIHGQLIAIRQKNRILIKKYGKSLDFLGNKGNMNGLLSLITGRKEKITISNLMEIRGKVKIIDLDLLDLEFSGDTINPIHIIIDNLSYFCSTFFLRWIFKLKI